MPIPTYFKLIKIPNQPPEHFYGNKEYKLSLCFKKKKKNINTILQKKASQMLFRLIEGNGKAVYLIGIKDNGTAIGISIDDLQISLQSLKKMALNIDAKITKINIYKGINGYIASVRLIKNILDKISINI